MKQRKISILLADDHALMRMGLRSLISFQPDMEVVGEAEDGEEAVSAAIALSPDVVIMDLMMPRTDGAEATRRILAERPETNVVILTSYGTSAALSRALASGAAGAQMKETPTDELLTAIRKVCKGERAIAPEIAEYLAAEPAPPDLTDLQADVLRSIMRGQSNQDIALQLGISPETVKKHLNAIFAKLGAATRAGGLRFAPHPKASAALFLHYPLPDMPNRRVQNVVDRAASCSAAPQTTDRAAPVVHTSN